MQRQTWRLIPVSHQYTIYHLLSPFAQIPNQNRQTLPGVGCRTEKLVRQLLWRDPEESDHSFVLNGISNQGMCPQEEKRKTP